MLLDLTVEQIQLIQNVIESRLYVESGLNELTSLQSTNLYQLKEIKEKIIVQTQIKPVAECEKLLE